MAEETEVMDPKRGAGWLELAGGGGVLVRDPQAPVAVRRRRQWLRPEARLSADSEGRRAQEG